MGERVRAAIDRQNQICQRCSDVRRGQAGERSCAVRDMTKIDAGIRIHDLPAIPLKFELSLDNFHTIRKCRLIWRDGDFIGVTFADE